MEMMMKQLTIMCSKELTEQIIFALREEGIDGYIHIPQAYANRFTQDDPISPFVTWGATIGMLICGFRWVRAKDGQRVGALHAFLRFLAMAVCAAPQAALMVLGTMFGMQKMKVVQTGRKFLSKRILHATWGARRTLADLASRTETLRPSSYS